MQILSGKSFRSFKSFKSDFLDVDSHFHTFTQMCERIFVALYIIYNIII